ncbi:B-box type zinc finger protein ncl-1 [Hypsibius exemplaris]|uniref:B-box type zinc finger protein ncl-1 n=1 Tax=Hypsibius exemplaris TaxID=2072580 RepID=A0A9X6NEG9_HYPEX|nr:B-box type zinc finger protein ncl-1 [Hypsibius exemplaris]
MSAPLHSSSDSSSNHLNSSQRICLEDYGVIHLRHPPEHTMTSLSPSASSISSDDLASSGSGNHHHHGVGIHSDVTGRGGPRTSPTNSLNSDTSSAAAAEMKLHCGICAETLRCPKVLHCLHTFCASCLENQLAAPDSDRLVCAECHMVTKLPVGGSVADLLPDYGMIRLLNANGACARTAMLCTACKGSEKYAQAQCLDCVNLLCSNCVVAHQLMHCFNRHRVFPLTDSRRDYAFGDSSNVFGASPAASSSGVPCPVHATERLELFCRSCDIPVCKECLECGAHPKSQQHEVALIAEVAQREIAGLMQIKEYAQAKAEEFTTVVANEPHRARMAAGYHSAQTAIEETFQFYTQILKERRDELLQSLDGMYDDKQTAVNMMQDRILDSNRRLTNVCHFMDRLLTYGSDAEILLFKRQLNLLTDNIISSQAETSIGWTGDIQFVTNYQAIQSSVQNSYGFIHKKADVATVPQVKSSQHQQQQQTQPQNGLSRLASINNGSHRSIPSLTALGMGDIGSNVGQVAAFPFPSNGSSHQVPGGFDRALPSGKRTSPPVYNLPFSSSGTELNMWMDNASPSSNADSFFNISSDTLVGEDAKTGSNFPPTLNPARPTIRRSKMSYSAKFGDFGTGDGQFSEPSGVSVNGNRDILVADTNNHRVQIFDHEGRFKFAFGECGKRDGQMLYPNRVAVARNGDVVVTERSPTHQIQVYNQYGVFVRKFGADILQHPRGVTVDHRGRVIVVECKVMRVVIFEPNGRIYSKFSCSQHLEFPNGVAANDNEEIFISDNRAHCVKVFNYHGIFLRQIGGEGMTNFPIGVCITERGHVVVADNHNNFNLTIFAQDGSLISAYESRVKHAQCFDLTLMDEGSVVLASKDYKVYVYRFASCGNNYPVVNDGLLHSSSTGNLSAPSSSSSSSVMRTGGAVGGSGSDFIMRSPLKNLIKCDYQ